MREIIFYIGLFLLNITPAFGQERFIERHLPQFIPGTMELYHMPNYSEPSGACKMGVTLELRKGLHGRIATLSRFGKNCETYFARTIRSYGLIARNAGCGSYRYIDEKSYGNEQPNIVILDHRKRTCDDDVPAQVVVRELINGKIKVRYSDDLTIQE